MDEIETDVVVVGGRGAGAASALVLARAGHRVVVLDRATSPSDTLATPAVAGVFPHPHRGRRRPVAPQRRPNAAIEAVARFLADLPRPTRQGALP
jgi:glycine/D-amino acid oxidase-like deaminating enzyme